MTNLLDILLHLDKHLAVLVNQYGMWSYAILFLIIFCETGLVITPFLPGDSLLFAVGALAAIGMFNIYWMIILLIVAAVIGDTVNYWFGYKFGEKISSSNSKFINKKHIQKTHSFYEKYGGKTIIIARFVPIVRTFAPFVAGIAQMTYLRFATYNILGGIIWVTLLLYAGYKFGDIPIIKRNFSIVVFAIIFISILPMIFEYFRVKFFTSKSV